MASATPSLCRVSKCVWLLYAVWVCLPVSVWICDLVPTVDQPAPLHWHLACGAENTLQAMQLIPAIPLPANHVHFSMSSHDCTHADAQLNTE